MTIDFPVSTTPDQRPLVRRPGPPEPTDVEAPRIDDPRLAEVISDTGRLVTLHDDGIFTEGPVWWEAESILVFSDIEGRRVLGWREDGAVEVVLDATMFVNGNAVDRHGRLVHCEHGRRAVSRSETQPQAGMPLPSPHILVDSYEDKPLNSPNDLLVAADGAIWFTDPTYGIDNPLQGALGEPEQGATRVYRFEPDAADPLATLTAVAEMDQPNGLAFSPDGSVLYISQTVDEQRGGIFAFDVVADGSAGQTLTNRRDYASVPQGLPDGFCVDERGWIWSSSGAGVCIFDESGAMLGLIPTPHTATNCTFDATGRRLFITGETSLFLLNLDN